MHSMIDVSCFSYSYILHTLRKSSIILGALLGLVLGCIFLFIVCSLRFTACSTLELGRLQTPELRQGMNFYLWVTRTGWVTTKPCVHPAITLSQESARGTGFTHPQSAESQQKAGRRGPEWNHRRRLLQPAQSLCVTQTRRAEITGRIRGALLYFKHLLWGKMHARGVVSTNTQNVLQLAL